MDEAKIAEIVKRVVMEVEPKKEQRVDVANTNVTIVLPVYNDMWFVLTVLRRLSQKFQMHKMDLIVSATSPDTDHAIAYFNAAESDSEKWPANQFNSYRFLGEFPNKGNREKNLEHMYYSMCQEVKTKYVWFQDADVLPPPGIIPAAVELLNTDPKLGFVGALYNQKADHVRMGNSLMLAEVAKDIDWGHKGNCVCRWLCEEELPRRGLSWEHIRDKADAEFALARHMPLEE